MDPSLSIVIPAFNEKQRLPSVLESMKEYIELNRLDYRVIVVDDGSSDGTDEIVSKISDSWPLLSIVRHATNRGKGAAVRTGVFAADGQLILFCDADGATPIEQEAKLRDALKTSDIAVGSRRVAESGKVNRTWFRALAGFVYVQLVRKLLSISVKDTQCGFKMFRRSVARALFKDLQDERFSFDVEILAEAEMRGYSISEVGVDWNEKDGGKTKVLIHGPQMLSSILKTRRRINANKHELQRQQRMVQDYAE